MSAAATCAHWGETSISRQAPDLRGRTAMVTGATQPLAIAMSDQLAARGAHLVLVAREHERLAMLAENLQARYGASIMLLAADLSQPETARMLFDTVQPQRPVDILIHHMEAPHLPDDTVTDHAQSHVIVQQHVVALCELTQRFAAAAGQRGWGRVLFICAPMEAPEGALVDATASASVAFIRQYAQSLHRRWRGSGLACTLLTGTTLQPAMSAASASPQELPPSALPQSTTTRLAQRALQALLRGAPRVASRRLRWL
ncbi:MAG: SDR family NAD(P)-dependent oxidoreductase [Algiphilus sp.]